MCFLRVREFRTRLLCFELTRALQRAAHCSGAAGAAAGVAAGVAAGAAAACASGAATIVERARGLLLALRVRDVVAERRVANCTGGASVRQLMRPRMPFLPPCVEEMLLLADEGNRRLQRVLRVVLSGEPFVGEALRDGRAARGVLYVLLKLK